MTATRKPPTPEPIRAAADPDQEAYMQFCAAIERRVRLTLLGEPSKIRDECRTIAQSKRVVADLIYRADGRPVDLLAIRDAMRQPWSREDYDHGDLMAEQVRVWAESIRAALPGPDSARIRDLVTGRAPMLASAMTGSGWFLKRDSYDGLRVRSYADRISAPAKMRSLRIVAQPSEREDAFAGAT